MNFPQLNYVDLEFIYVSVLLGLEILTSSNFCSTNYVCFVGLYATRDVEMFIEIYMEKTLC